MRVQMLALVAAIGIAGCSGGAGAAGTSQTGTQSSSITPLQQQNSAQSTLTAVSDAQGAVEASAAVSIAGNVSPQSWGSLEYNHCYQDNTVSFMLMQPSSGRSEIRYYFDTACSQLARDVVHQVTSQGSGSETVQTTVTRYNRSGSVVATRQRTAAVVGTTNNETIQTTSKLFLAGSSQPNGYGESEWTIGGAASPYNISGDGAAISNRTDGSHGTDSTRSGTKSVDGSGDSIFAMTVNAAVFESALGALSLSSSSPYQVLPQSDQTSSGTRTVSASFDQTGLLYSLQVSGSDRLGDTISITTGQDAGGQVQFNGTLTTSGGTPLATFYFDQYGDGYITYSNGKTDAIIDFTRFGTAGT